MPLFVLVAPLCASVVKFEVACFPIEFSVVLNNFNFLSLGSSISLLRKILISSPCFSSSFFHLSFSFLLFLASLCPSFLFSSSSTSSLFFLYLFLGCDSAKFPLTLAKSFAGFEIDCLLFFKITGFFTRALLCSFGLGLADAKVG